MKVKILKVEKKQWNDKVFYEVALEGDERQYTCWNDSVQLWKDGMEVDADIREKDTDKGKKYYINAAGGAGSAGQKGGGWKPKDKKEIAINCSTALCCKLIEKNPAVDIDMSVEALKHYYKAIFELIKD